MKKRLVKKLTAYRVLKDDRAIPFNQQEALAQAKAVHAQTYVRKVVSARRRFDKASPKLLTLLNRVNQKQLDRDKYNKYFVY